MSQQEGKVSLRFEWREYGAPVISAIHFHPVTSVKPGNLDFLVSWLYRAQGIKSKIGSPLKMDESKRRPPPTPTSYNAENPKDYSYSERVKNKAILEEKLRH